MQNKYFHLVLVFISLVFMMLGCASNRVSEAGKQSDKHFNGLINKYKTDPQSVSYQTLWSAYLKSSQPEQTVLKHDTYLALLAKIKSKQLSCSDVDWEAIVGLNYWSIKPHLSAVECYKQLDDQAKVDFHEGFVGFILQGVFASGYGEHYYDAYEAASWGDVQDILELAGFKYIDTYLDLRGANQGVYYVVVAEDVETGVQRLFYFDNIEFINRVMGNSGRINSAENSLGFTVATSLANSVGHAAIALGDILAAGEEYEAASDWYLKTSLRDSPIAYMRLARLCLKNRLPNYTEEACLEFVTKAAELEYFEAYVLLSGLYSEGIWVEKDPQLSHDFLQIAFNKFGKGQSLADLADFYIEEVFGENRFKTAKKYYKRAVKEGYVSSSYVRLLSYQNARKNIKEEEYYALLKKLADQGNALAQFKYAASFLGKLKSSKDPEVKIRAKKYMQLSADQLLPQALYAMGVMHEYGLGVDADKSVAVDYWFAAGNRWHAAAQYEVASYLRDKGGLKNEKKAFDWMYSAAREGDDDAYVTLGYFYEHGTGTDQDLDKAYQYYMKAAAKDNAYGLYNVGYFLRYGKGVLIDLKQALEYFLKAEAKGSRGAPYQIALMYESGIGVEKSITQAKKWYQKAADKGHSASKLRLKNW
ncbi:MAG: tetratricopeptide repeat protein [Enterobacterales bacterium]|nr:tetratricopeptide repeat protein [Enterobacterales bacterium]